MSLKISATEAVFNWRKEEYTRAKVNFDEKEEKEEKEDIDTLEKTIQGGSLPQDWDVYSPAGGFKLTEDINTIDGFVQKKFKDLKESGLIMSRSEFEKREDPTKFRKPGIQHKDSPSKVGDLTRLWGAEYLREKLKSRKNYDVPRTIIVIEDGITTLPITVKKDKLSVVVKQFDTDKGEILVEDIKDSAATCSIEQHGWMSEIGYVDFADAGNIREKNGTYYVVDTEWKSLDGVTTLDIPSFEHINPDINMYRLRRYANERFDAVYTDEWKKEVNVDLR